MAKSTGEMGEPCGRPVLTLIGSIDAHDDLPVPYEAVDLVDLALIDVHGPHLPKQAASCHAGQGGSDVHQEDRGDASAAPGLLGLCNGDTDRITARAACNETKNRDFAK